MRGQSEEFRFWSKVRKTKKCWFWVGMLDGWGYGTFCIKTKNYKVTHVKSHRYVFEKNFGKIPKGYYICHHCDNPSCVRIDHLFLGTALDNNRDRARKGRSAKGKRHGTKTCPESVARGEKASNSVLKEDQVFDIRDLYKTGDFTHLELANRFGVDRSCVTSIVNRRSWDHI